MVDSILKNVDPSWGDYEKAKYVFEYLAGNVEYQMGTEQNQNIISVFLNKKTVCQGYANATQYLLTLLGIPAVVVTGTAEGDTHAWNLVQLDGAYYFMDKSTQSIAPNKKVTIAELDGVKPLLMKGVDDDDDHHGHDHGAGENSDDDHHHGIYNMHLWLSPEIARLSAVAIHDKLLELMPQSRAKLDANLKDFEAKLAATDKQVGTELAPLKGKGYFVFHDAYGYFEKHYGLTSLGHFTVNPEIQPGAQRLHEIRTQLVEQKATCVFAEPQFRPAVIEAVARGTSVRMGTLDPLGIGIKLGKESYPQFLSQMANQYSSCLKGE